MGMQQIKNMVVGEAMSTAAQASTVAQAVAAQSAWAPAAMSAAIATMGAAVTAGSASYMSAMAASKTMAVAGARYNGGPVDANKMYRVGENGQPEIFKASNGHQYMIPVTAEK